MKLSLRLLILSLLTILIASSCVTTGKSIPESGLYGVGPDSYTVTKILGTGAPISAQLQTLLRVGIDHERQIVYMGVDDNEDGTIDGDEGGSETYQLSKSPRGYYIDTKVEEYRLVFFFDESSKEYRLELYQGNEEGYSMNLHRLGVFNPSEYIF